MLHIRNGERDQTNLRMSQHNKKYQLQIRSEVSGYLKFGYVFKTFFFQNGKRANRKYIEKAFSDFFKVKIQSVAGTTM